MDEGPFLDEEGFGLVVVVAVAVWGVAGLGAVGRRGGNEGSQGEESEGLEGCMMHVGGRRRRIGLLLT